MGPSGTRIDNTSATATTSNYYSVTYYPTYNNEADSKEVEEERLAEIERLEDMMHERAEYEDNKFHLQHKEVHHARLAHAKHKRPHMNRRIIR